MRIDLLWSALLIICAPFVAYGYFHQGRLVKKTGITKNISVRLPLIVFFLQFSLGAKGVYYRDYSVIFNSVCVDSMVVYYLAQIFFAKRRERRLT